MNDMDRADGLGADPQVFEYFHVVNKFRPSKSLNICTSCAARATDPDMETFSQQAQLNEGPLSCELCGSTIIP